MLILGIDTSCDDTAAALVEDGRTIVSSVVSSQNEIHEKYGGIVPELASRRHIEMVLPVVDEALARASAGLDDIGVVAVTYAPGLIGSLIVGVNFAKAVSYAGDIPLVAVNHLEGHIFAASLESAPDFPFIALVVSGGHTSLYMVEGFGIYRELGRTRDDAAGEAYDKVAKLLGLGYPGGPALERLARSGDPDAVGFPRADMGKSFDFSFSGLKTAVSNYIRKGIAYEPADIAASFQEAVIDMLLTNSFRVAVREGINRIVLSGGVAANAALRDRFRQESVNRGFELFVPSLPLCTDNAAMIAAAGCFRHKNGELAGLDINPKAFLPIGVSL